PLIKFHMLLPSATAGLRPVTIPIIKFIHIAKFNIESSMSKIYFISRSIVIAIRLNMAPPKFNQIISFFVMWPFLSGLYASIAPKLKYIGVFKYHLPFIYIPGSPDIIEIFIPLHLARKQ